MFSNNVKAKTISDQETKENDGIVEMCKKYAQLYGYNLYSKYNFRYSNVFGRFKTIVITGHCKGQ